MEPFAREGPLPFDWGKSVCDANIVPRHLCRLEQREAYTFHKLSRECTKLDKTCRRSICVNDAHDFRQISKNAWLHCEVDAIELLVEELTGSVTCEKWESMKTARFFGLILQARNLQTGSREMIPTTRIKYRKRVSLHNICQNKQHVSPCLDGMGEEAHKPQQDKILAV